jgi:hypothetical protein
MVCASLAGGVTSDKRERRDMTPLQNDGSVLQKIIDTDRVSLQMLSAYSGFTLDDLSYALHGGKVYETDAKRILSALQRITGKIYCLEQSGINWIAEKP